MGAEHGEGRSSESFGLTVISPLKRACCHSSNRGTREGELRNKWWKRTVLMVLVSLLSVVSVKADFYQWVDEHGQNHLTTDPPPKKSKPTKVIVSENGRSSAPSRSSGKKLHDAGVLVNSSPFPSSAPASPSKSRSNAPLPFLQPAASPTVEIYSADWCGVCTKTKAYFRSKGVAFTEYNVDNDSSAASRARSLYPSGGIPVTVINGKTIVGYSPSQFEAALHVQ